MICSLCGTESAETLTWTVSVERGRRVAYCEECSREHLRSIEGKLDAEWF